MSPGTLRLRSAPRTLIGGAMALGLLALLLHGFFGSSSVRQAYVEPVTLMPPAPIAPAAPQMKHLEEPLEPVRSTELRDEGIGEGGPVTDAPPVPGTGAGERATGPLGFNEAGEAGGDEFGLAARRGGREFLSTAPRGGGDPNARFFRYADALQSYLQVQLNEVEELRRACYSIEVEVRVGAEGRMQNVEIHRSTGDPVLDARIRDVFSRLRPIDHPPPPDMPWPVGLRIVSRRADCAGSPGSN